MVNDSRSKYPKLISLAIFMLLFFVVYQPFVAVAETRKIRVGAFDYYPGIFMDKDGKVKGFFVDLLDSVAEAEGWDIEYVYGSWSEGLDRIKNGEIDLLTSAAKTEERKLFLDFCRTPLLTVWGEVYVHSGSDLDSLLNMNGKKIAVMKNDFNASYFKKYAEAFGLSCEYIEMTDFDNVLKSVEAKKTDGGVVNSTYGSGKISFYDVKGTGIVFNPFDIFFAAAKSKDTQVIETLDSYLEAWKNDMNSVYYVGIKKWLRKEVKGNNFIPLWVWQTLAVFFLIALIFALFSAALRMRVRKATDKVLAYSLKLKESEARLTEFMRHVPALILIKDSELRPVYANERYMHYFPFEEWQGKAPHETFSEELADSMVSRDLEALDNGYVSYEEEWTDKAGEKHVFLTQKFRMDGIGGSPFLGAIISDITERKKAEEALQEMTVIFRLFMENNPIYVFIKDENIRPIYLSKNYEKMLNRPLEEVLGKGMDELFPPELAGPMIEDDKKILRDGKLFEIIEELDGRTYNTIKFPIMINGVPRFLAGYTIDITDKTLAEEEKNRLYAQLLQSQKMESVGRLAGGVAHDFNNMLQAIIGFSDMALMKIEEGSSLHGYLIEIQKAANRSAELTKQLLGFARKQAVIPRILDLNDSIPGLLKMIGRMMGEEINLIWMPGSSLKKVKMDPTQIDQILTNLCVNSRDAMNGKGAITIKTRNMELDPIYCMHHAGAIPGDYVMLSVSDNGSGIEEDLLSKIFEPFFTTKDVGEGSGLGLSTVYGIVKQNCGFIDVTSSPGNGTTFDVYIPICEEELELGEKDDGSSIKTSGTETILLVEDEGVLLSLGKAILRHHGYRVMSALKPQDALDIANQYEGDIDLLITDVIMPEMNGRELAEKIAAIKPKTKCLFMSGYANDLITKRGALGRDSVFIQKPFSAVELASKVREVLDA